MKVFISADIEGICSTVKWAECNQNERFYPEFAAQMTEEVVVACNGAIDAGAKEILIKDAHGWAANINPNSLPECARLIRGWTGHPYSMVQGIDSTFDAAMFVGYHSAGGRDGNPLAHTITSKKYFYIKINDQIASELTLFSYAAAYEGVPTVFLSGDKMLCEEAKEMHPKIHTVSVKEGVGAAVISMVPKKALKLIREGAKNSLSQNLEDAKIILPETFTVEICYKDHTIANSKSYYPGMKKIDAHTLLFQSDNYFEVLRMLKFAN